MSAVDTAFGTWLAGMAQFTVFCWPGDHTIMTGTAEFAVNNLLHGHVVGTGAHLESKFRVTHLAPKTYSMKPVRKYYRTYSLGFRTFIEHHVTIFSVRD